MSTQPGAAPSAPSPPSWKGLPAVLTVAKENLGLLSFLVLGFFVCLALLGEFFIDADWVDRRLGLSKKVAEGVRAELVKKVDSGYSRTFIFRPGETTAENVLSFYAERGQTAKISITTEASHPDDVRFEVRIDGLLWSYREQTLFKGNFNTPELSPLTFRPDQGSFHEAIFVIKRLYEGERFIVKCVVLVYNNAKPES